ncbi:MAG: nucleoside-diphosphate-sugar epimerase, partial [Dysgonamonadaceae bacterium]
HKLTENYVVSNQKIKSALGIEKIPLSAHEGIRKTLENFKKS